MLLRPRLELNGGLVRLAAPMSFGTLLLPDWSIPLGAVYWVAPPEGPLSKRVEVLRDFLIDKLKV